MADHKKGDWIRVDAEVEEVLPRSKAVTVRIPLSGRSDPAVKKRFESMRGHSWVIESPGIHEMPIVPEVDLLEELKLRDKAADGPELGLLLMSGVDCRRLASFRAAREKATEPKSKGRRVLVLAEVVTEHPSGNCTYKLHDTSEPKIPKFCTGPVLELPEDLRKDDDD